MRHLVILACVIIYAVASPVKNEEVNKKIEDVIEEKSSDIVLDVSENKEESAEGRDIIQVVKTEKDGHKTIHIHSPNPPNINIMPTKYQITANPQPAFVPYNTPMQYGQGIKDENRLKERNRPKNQVNIYVYFMNGENGTMALETKGTKEVRTDKTTMVPIEHVTLKTPVTKPTLQYSTRTQGLSVPQETSDTKGTSGTQGTLVPQSLVPKQKPTLIAVCPKGHVKILGACVEYDLD